MNSISKTKLPVAVEWPIPEHRLQEMKNKPGKPLRSEDFIACDSPSIKYYLSIQSYKPGHERHGNICIFFYLHFLDDINVEASFNFAIESANFLAKNKHVYESSEGWGGICCKNEELFDPEKRFIVNGKLDIKMDGFLMIEKEEEEKKWECSNTDDFLGVGLWEQEDNKDFTVEVGEKQISVHKCVLAHRSPVFARKFQSSFKEAEENKITIKDFSFDLVETAIKLCYHHSLAPTVSLEDKLTLLQFFAKYDMQTLKHDLECYLVTVINEITVCRVANCSLLSNSVKLKMKCADFLQHCLRERKPINDFDTLDKDLAMNILKNSFSHLSG